MDVDGTRFPLNFRKRKTSLVSTDNLAVKNRKRSIIWSKDTEVLPGFDGVMSFEALDCDIITFNGQGNTAATPTHTFRLDTDKGRWLGKIILPALGEEVDLVLRTTLDTTQTDLRLSNFLLHNNLAELDTDTASWTSSRMFSVPINLTVLKASEGVKHAPFIGDTFVGQIGTSYLPGADTADVVTKGGAEPDLENARIWLGRDIFDTCPRIEFDKPAGEMRFYCDPA